MRRLLRILLSAATLVSLLLLASTICAGVWLGNGVRSIRIGGDGPLLSSQDGRLELFSSHRLSVGSGSYGYREIKRIELPGIYYRHNVLAYSYRDEDVRIIGVAYWLLWTASCIAPAAVILARYRRRRRAADDGRCLTCGYDLRATPERCPECGTVPAPPRA